MAFNTLVDLYSTSIDKFGANRCFTMFEGEQLTYRDVALRVDEVVEMLLAAGLQGGDKVALLSNNMPNWGVCYFATLKAGMVVVPILPDFSGEELDKIIVHSEAKALLVSDKLFAKISKATLKGLNVVIRTKNLGIIHTKRNLTKATLTPPTAESLAAIIYTSGTTSKPKGVMLTHGALCAQIDMLYDLYPIHESDVWLSILPMSHTYECSVGFIYPFSCGSSMTYIDKPPTASTLMPALKAVRPTIMLSVPLVIEKIYRSQVLGKFKGKISNRIYNIGFVRRMVHRMAGKKLYEAFGGRLRFFGIGGAKLDATCERFLLEAKFPYAIGYGLTETAPLIAGALPDFVRLGSTGPILPKIQYRLENINPASGEGELVINTPSIMSGYYHNPDATAAAFTADGWFRTNDLCCFDKDNFLYVKGRINSMIVGPSGENIYPEEIESVINGHFLVSESIVQQEKGKLVALVNFDKEALERKYQHLKEEWGYRMEEVQSEILQYVNSKVNKFSKIATVRAHEDEFEKTPTKKIKRFLYKDKK